MSHDLETIRWPTTLDRQAIETRLEEVRDDASRLGLAKLSGRFADAHAMSAAEIAANVVAALAWLFDLPEHKRARYDALIRQLEMVALNLKNLK